MLALRWRDINLNGSRLTIEHLPEPHPQGAALAARASAAGVQ
jgi:hypothetical protein